MDDLPRPAATGPDTDYTLTIEDALLHPVHIFGELVRLGGMVWGCSEALRYHVGMRRRLALGARRLSCGAHGMV